MDLQLLGLNTYESKAYESLIRLAEGTASEISQESGVPYGRIYDVLASLEHKGFVSVVPAATKTYVPTDPEKLSSLLEEKHQELSEVESHLSTLKQQYTSQDHKVVEVARGHKNFFRIVKETPKSNEYSYSIKYTSRYHPEWVRKDKQAAKRGIKKKTLTRYDKETKQDVQKWLSVNSDIRKFPNEGVALSISDTSVMIALIKQNTTLLVKDSAFSDVMKRLFEAAYKDAPDITQ